MPVYNREKMVVKSVESILSQTFENFEFLIIDDGSTDSTFKTLRQLAKIDKRIKVWQNKRNLGIARTRNLLLRKAVGKYVVWQDSDDFSLPYRIEKQYDFMQKNPGVVVCGSFLSVAYDCDREVLRRYSADDSILKKNIFRQSPVAQPAAIIRRREILQAGGYNETLNFAEDLDLYLRIGQKYEFSNLQLPLVKYMVNSDSVSFNKVKEVMHCSNYLRKKAVKEYGYRMTIKDKIHTFLVYLATSLPETVIFWLFEKSRKG